MVAIELGKKWVTMGKLQLRLIGFFWNMAKEWLVSDANWHDPQTAFDTFRKRVFDYMCEGGTWACCTAGVRDVSCRDPPKPMQDVIFILMDPTENMPVIFLFWWCVNVRLHRVCSLPFPSPTSHLRR